MNAEATKSASVKALTTLIKYTLTTLMKCLSQPTKPSLDIQPFAFVLKNVPGCAPFFISRFIFLGLYITYSGCKKCRTQRKNFI